MASFFILIFSFFFFGSVPRGEIAYPLCGSEGTSQSPIDIVSSPSTAAAAAAAAAATADDPASAVDLTPTDVDQPRRAGPEDPFSAAAAAPVSSSPSSSQTGTVGDFVRPPASLPLTLTVKQNYGTPYYHCEPPDPDAGTSVTGAFCGCLVDKNDGEKMYALDSIHFHAPSENTVDGKAYPMEMHMVHVADDGALAVLGVLFEHAVDATAANEAMTKLMEQHTAGGGGGGGGEGGEGSDDKVEVDTSALYDASSGFWTWNGSLTTPPCSEGVLWMLQKKTEKVTAADANAFKEHVGGYPGTARPTQPLNGRTVTSYEPAAN